MWDKMDEKWNSRIGRLEDRTEKSRVEIGKIMGMTEKMSGNLDKGDIM